MLPLLVSLVLQAWVAQPARCGASDTALLAAARGHQVRGDERAAVDTLRKASPECAATALARASLLAWSEARALAAKGAPAQLAAPLRDKLNEFDRLGGRELTLEAEYAKAAVFAALAAAQDERQEMELWLTHARDLFERASRRGSTTLWPLSYNLLAGELWFEVDRYDEARAAFERAVHADASPLALVGLARAQARLGHAEACTTYRKLKDVPPALDAGAAQDLARCR